MKHQNEYIFKPKMGSYILTIILVLPIILLFFSLSYQESLLIIGYIIIALGSIVAIIFGINIYKRDQIIVNDEGLTLQNVYPSKGEQIKNVTFYWKEIKQINFGSLNMPHWRWEGSHVGYFMEIILKDNAYHKSIAMYDSDKLKKAIHYKKKKHVSISDTLVCR